MSSSRSRLDIPSTIQNVPLEQSEARYFPPPRVDLARQVKPPGSS